MAKQQPDLSALFRPTEAPDRDQAERSAPASTPERDRTLPIGVGLKQSELAQLDAIAAELGIARNALMRWAVSYFLREYGAGNIELTVDREERRRVRMP
jgi:hypothetical protein